MKLNTKGLEVYNKWERVYYDELARQRAQRDDPDWIEGWSIIEDYDHCNTIDDCIGVAIYGDDDNAIYHILDYYKPDEEYAYGYSAAQVIEMMKPYFIIDSTDDLSWNPER